MLKKLTFLILLGLIGLQLNVSAQAPVFSKTDLFSNFKLRTWYGFNSQHQLGVLDLDSEEPISENEFEELMTLRTFFRDTLTFQCLKTDIDGTQKIVDVSLVLSSEFMCAVETWNTACGFPNGRVIVYIEGGVTDYHVSIWRNSDGVKVFQADNSNTRFEKLDLKADGYKVIVDDSNTPVHNNYTLFNAEVKTSSSPVISIDAKYNENCGGRDGWIQAKAVSGVGPYKFKLLKTGEENFTGKFINLSFGTYEIEVSDANFCKDITSATIFNIGTPVYSKPIERKLCSFIKSLDTLKSGFTKSGCDTFTVFKNLLAKTSFDTLKFSTCDTTKVGVFLDTAFKHTGLSCDSLRKYKEFYLKPKGYFYSFEFITSSCRSDSARLPDTLRSFDGCDSLFHVRSWIYVGVLKIPNLTRDTCISSPDRIDTLRNPRGCDSIYYVTHFNVLPKDTVRLTESWCKPRNPDISYFFNHWGCESIKIISYLVKPLDTVRVVKDTCYQGLKNSYYMNLKTKDGFCDSIVLTTLNVLKTDTIRDSLYVCGLKVSKQSKKVIPNHLGCDSLITLIDSLAPPAILRSTVFRYSCDVDSVKQGTYYDTTLFNYGCIKSIVTLRLRDGRSTFNPPDTILINQKIDTIRFVSRFYVNQYGCDSLVIRKWVYDKADTTLLRDSICGFNNFVVDSIQKLKTTLGSDSTVIKTVVTTESPDLHKEYLKDNSAIYSWDGEIRVSASGGTAPYTFTWNDGEVGPWRRNLKGGDYSVTLTDKNGCPDSMNFTVLYFWVHPTQSVREVLAEGYFANCDQARLTFFNTEGHEIGSVEVDATNKIEVLQKIDISGVVVVRAECISGIDTGKFLKTKSTFVR